MGVDAGTLHRDRAAGQGNRQGTGRAAVAGLVVFLRRASVVVQSVG